MALIATQEGARAMKRVMLALVIVTSFVVASRRSVGYAAEMQAPQSSNISSAGQATERKKAGSSSHRRSLFPQKHTPPAVAPGEGLGCFYHQGYYSHLPLFKDGVYTLPGSREVSEPYRRPMTPLSTPAAEPQESSGEPQGNVTVTQ